MKKKELDLDAALEEVASKLRPAANVNCSMLTKCANTGFDTHTGGAKWCVCQCCSDPTCQLKCTGTY